MTSPYVQGTTLPLQSDGQSLHVTVVQAFPPTLSCASVVSLDWPSLKLKGTYVLKVFDRRFATQLRRDSKAKSWTPEVEKRYHQFASTGGLSRLIPYISQKETDEDWSETDERWDQAQLETYLQYRSLKLYKTEKEVYGILHAFQGKDIPYLYANVNIKTATGPDYENYDCPGILMEYVQGFPLTDIERYAPQANWQGICERAIRIVNQIGEKGIRNEDVKTRSFIIKSNGKVAMIDFASCVVRRPGQSKEDWEEWKAMQDEEGAVGCTMEKKLKGKFTYKRSMESRRLMDRYMRE
ncbi:hypothetical protein K491DRAFT_755570 [Lophiostoma macrostomum CBS 122681]|uniref:Protein kinase domain-containing protein n=1 Tax=Lophiostoma macrostomum CBS 122681 TaxID=1314788 RepID=A0A6A6TKG2_9PLEO|nr:hypothetical protein K491DRAFT_755570 [Lophiostoma macrostomum CBS 122681]